MDVKTLISANAQMVRVVELQKGNIYKRVNEGFSGSYELVYGIVLDVLHGPDATFIDTVEVKKQYGDASFDFKVLGEKSDMNIYPTTKEELVEYFGGIESAIKKGIDDARDALKKKEQSYKMFKDITSENFAKLDNTKYELLKGAK